MVKSRPTTYRMAQSMTPGTYMVLFGFYLHILRRREFSKHRWLHGAIISLFVLCTAHCIFLFAGTVLINNLDVLETISPSSSLLPSGAITFAALNSTTNSLYVTSK
jgi:uncharacterized metal-binding protein